MPRRRRQQNIQRQVIDKFYQDPFRLQAQHFYDTQHRLLEDEPSTEVKLPVLRPRYLDMYGQTTKGIPNQTYVDVILDRKGPFQSMPVSNRPAHLKVGRKYDDSMVIKSYRNGEEVTSEHERRPSNTNAANFSRIMLIAPQKIQYAATRGDKIYTMDKGTSPMKIVQEHNSLQFKGSKLNLHGIEHDLPSEGLVYTTVSKRKLVKSLQKQRKKLSSRDREFVKEIKRRQHRADGKDNLQDSAIKGKAALPPIRITVTNPIPSPISQNEKSQAEMKTELKEEEDQKLSKHLLQVPKENHQKRAKRRKKLERSLAQENLYEEERKEMLESDSNFMPAPVTKITFETFNPANIKRKPSNNVQVEQIVQGNVVATKPKPGLLKPVALSNMEMGAYDHDIVHKKDGTYGPAPPSTNYVNFQRTTRLGGQSRVLLAMRQKHKTYLNHIEEDFTSDGNELDVSNNFYYLTDSGSNKDSVNAMPTDTRKLGKIHVLNEATLAQAHNALMDDEDSRVDIGSLSDDGSLVGYRQRRARKPGRLVTKSIQVPNTIPQGDAQRSDVPITGFYMGATRDNRSGEIIVQLPKPEDLLAPPNTAYQDTRDMNSKVQ